MGHSLGHARLWQVTQNQQTKNNKKTSDQIMNSLFMNPGLEPIAIQIISYLDINSFLKLREVNKTLLSLIDNELSLWRNALKNQMRPIDITKLVTQTPPKKKCVCNQLWKKAAKPFVQSLEGLKILVQQRFCQKNYVCMNTSSPFEQACYFASPSLLELIINHLAQTDDTTMEHRNVFDIACQSGRLEAVQLVWKIWKEQGIDFTQKSSEAPKPIFCAFRSINPLVFQFVLDQDVDINEKDDFKLPHHGHYSGNGRSLIHNIVACPTVKSFRPQNNAILLSNCQGKNIDWNAQDDNGDTPLIWTLKNISFCKIRNWQSHYCHHVRALKNLLEAADTLIDVHLPNRIGETAWKYVLESDREIYLAVKNHMSKMEK